jgi:hypothetical protein
MPLLYCNVVIRCALERDARCLSRGKRACHGAIENEKTRMHIDHTWPPHPLLSCSPSKECWHKRSCFLLIHWHTCVLAGQQRARRPRSVWNVSLMISQPAGLLTHCCAASSADSIFWIRKRTSFAFISGAMCCARVKSTSNTAPSSCTVARYLAGTWKSS